MSAYVVFMREKTINQSELEACWERVKDSLDGNMLFVNWQY